MKKQGSENYSNNPKSHESLLVGSLLTQHFQITVNIFLFLYFDIAYIFFHLNKIDCEYNL